MIKHHKGRMKLMHLLQLISFVSQHSIIRLFRMVAYSYNSTAQTQLSLLDFRLNLVSFVEIRKGSIKNVIKGFDYFIIINHAIIRFLIQLMT